jgi:hypothetical protein
MDRAYSMPRAGSLRSRHRDRGELDDGRRPTGAEGAIGPRVDRRRAVG